MGRGDVICACGESLSVSTNHNAYRDPPFAFPAELVRLVPSFDSPAFGPEPDITADFCDGNGGGLFIVETFSFFLGGGLVVCLDDIFSGVAREGFCRDLCWTFNRLSLGCALAERWKQNRTPASNVCTNFLHCGLNVQLYE